MVADEKKEVFKDDLEEVMVKEFREDPRIMPRSFWRMSLMNI
ncbi:hypothetical protein FACS1894152_6230 [Bacilli bacterium]|nr:hypothetical protein FACS1894152_6230 [Bacilli bacterium]